MLQMMASDLALDDKIERFVDTYHTLFTRHPYLLPFAISESARHPEIVETFYTPKRRKAATLMIAKVRQQIGDRSPGVAHVAWSSGLPLGECAGGDRPERYHRPCDRRSGTTRRADRSGGGTA
jgi:hypothetical protein